MTGDRPARIRAALEAALPGCRLDLVDESHLHAGHPGARDGRGHFRVRIVSQAFDGANRVKRHRIVFDAVGELMKTDIHALSIDALTPAEADKSGVA